MAAVSVEWRRGGRAVAGVVTHEFIASRVARGRRRPPIALVTEDGVPEIRVRLDEAGVAAHPVLAELRDAGFTDYYIQGLPFEKGQSFVAWSTDAPGGFSDEEMAILDEVRPLLALRVELASAYEATRGLLEVYLGKNASRRVLDGAFRRAGGEKIRAVVFTCDIRGFTTLVDKTPVDEVLALLDAHFERVARPITEAGGEILKFIGDALLAIFPVGDDAPDACRRALAAADRALEVVAADGTLRMGVGLHVGEVVYGNVGASDRLDFTVIGAAVNEVARVESLCKELGVPLLATAALAGASGGGLVSVGKHVLRGVAEPAELFTLARFRR